ncbi:hypothetical protein GCM10009718_28060 [Isoptericola halotolerans]|uniref:DUF3093 family protein n=1 Tax=Isoptericola halotolerans TaxID=300560 RepID=A0ABX2A3W2_9MICO|nr:hypothetical protein [Isoptericola halotolerans]NOV97344.1 hypothetical protein [Isoptericola halotolerans]
MSPRRLATNGGLAGLASVLIVLLYAAYIGRRLGDPGVLGGIAVLLAVAALAVGGWAGVVATRVRGQVARVARHRPGTPLVVGRPTAALTAEAGRLQAGTRGLPPDCPDREHVVYALLTDRVELWVRGDEAPRWWVTLPASVEAGSTRGGGSTVDVLTVRDATARLDLLPTSTDARAWPSRAHRASAVEQVLAHLSR